MPAFRQHQSPTPAWLHCRQSPSAPKHRIISSGQLVMDPADTIFQKRINNTLILPALEI